MKRLYVLVVFFGSVSNLLFGQVVINEICPANADINYDPVFYNFSGWVELYNKGTSSVNITGYYLTNDESKKTKWLLPYGSIVPAKGYLTIWCDEENYNLHTNFKLDNDGETLLLYKAGLAEADRVTFPKQFTNISYGRLTDGDGNWGYQISPSPGIKNVGAKGAQRVDQPLFSVPAGRYSGALTVTLSHFDSKAVIRYTTNGSEPDITSTLYTNPIAVSKTSTVKAKAFVDGFLPSKTEVNSYFVGEHAFSLPVISLSLNNKYLQDNQIGIYVDGTNGISGNCTENLVNWNREWDRHSTFEYFEPSGKKILSQDIDIRIGGACSRNNPQKSLVMKARDKYGNNIIEHDFFKSKPITEFGGFILRNSGNDFWYTMFRDALMQTLPIGQMDLDYMAYQPTIVYINGKYWGIQNLREKIDGDYIKSNYGIDKDDVDILETWTNSIEGSSDNYNYYLNTLQQMDLSTDEAFTFIDENIDVQEFINYLTAEIYYCNTDWPGNNIKMWKQRSGNGKFRWILWDTDFGFGLYSDRSYATHPTLDFVTATDGPEWPNPPYSTLHIRSLLANPTFRNRFIQTLTTSLSTTFKPERVVSMIDSFRDNIKAEMPYHLVRWGQGLGNIDYNLDNWNYQVQVLRDFALQRNEFMKGHIATFFGLSESVVINTESFPFGSGGVTLNGITATEPITDGFYYKNLPFTMVATPAPGYEFSYFNVQKKEVTTFNLINKGDSWSYFDSGMEPSSTWAQSDFDDVTWKEGNAELGYGDNDEETIVSYGPDAANKFITTYFRKAFSVADTVGLEALSGSVQFDDGVVLYLNGEEIYRNNLPSGTISYNTLALAGIPSESAYFPFTIPKGKIKPGQNIISAEVHQNSPGSSDISFNFDLKAFRSGAETEYTITEPEFSEIANSNILVQAYFKPVVAKDGIIINEFSASNDSYEDPFGQKDDWIELYNNGNEAVDLSHFYMTDNLNNKTKHKILNAKNGETIVAPGEYKILWADEQVTQGPLHLNFKLSASGESIGIYQPVGSEIMKVDELSFTKQSPFTSFSRIPNLTGPFTLTAAITPEAENIFDTPTATDTEVNSEINVYPNPTTGLIDISGGIEADRIRIYNGSGQMIKQIDGLRNSSLSIETYPSGLYTLVFYSSGKIFTKRVIKQ
jgi:hypothetical protein